jgi:serine/threonine protein kinase
LLNSQKKKKKAKGCTFLHSTSPPVMHRDLKSPNILLADVSPEAEVVAKVCDFGVSLSAAAQAAGRRVDCPGIHTLFTYY